MTPTSPDRRLAIALVTPHYPPLPIASGVATYIKTLAHALADRGHSVHVITRVAAGTGADVTEREANVTVHWLGPPRFDIPASLSAASVMRSLVAEIWSGWRYRRKLERKLDALIREEAVELIEAVDSAAEALFYNPRRHSRVPFIVRLHGPTSVVERFDRNVPEALRRLIRFFERRQLLKASHVTAPSRPMADLCREELRLTKPIEVYANPSTAKPSTFEPRPIATPSEGDPHMVLFVGRVVPSKGVHLLVQSAAIVLEHCPDTKFVFVGSHGPADRRHGSFRDQLLSLVPPRHHAALQFVGYKSPDEVTGYYQQAAICVFPSLFEAFGYTCLEAMACGKAIIGSRNGGMLEMLCNGAGVLYTPPSVDELAGHIVKLLRDPVLRQRLGETARRRVLEAYQPDVVLDNIEAYYRRALADVRG